MKVILCLFAICNVVVNGGFLNGGNDIGGYNHGNSHDADDVGPIIAALYANGGHGDGGDGHYDTADLAPIIASLVNNHDDDYAIGSDSGSNGGLNSEILQTIAALFGNYGTNLGFSGGQSSSTAAYGHDIETILAILNTARH